MNTRILPLFLATGMASCAATPVPTDIVGPARPVYVLQASGGA